MDRSAIFVDAGYLLAAGGLLTCGTGNRRAFTCSYQEVVAALEKVVVDHSGGMASLRTYWYDGAPESVPTPDHLKIGALPYVKVRLGRLIHGEQKGSTR